LLAVHASGSRGFVAESQVKNKSINGGWNAVGLSGWVRYSDKVEGVLAGLLGEESEATGSSEGDDLLEVQDSVLVDSVSTALVSASPASAAPLSPKRYVRVVATDGNPVKIREMHDSNIWKYKAPVGTVMLWTGTYGEYLKVIYMNKERLIKPYFAVECDADGAFPLLLPMG